MLKINDQDGILKEKISFSDCLINLLMEYKKNNQIADYSFAVNLMNEICNDESINGKYICSCNNSTITFSPITAYMKIDSETLKNIIVNYMNQKRKKLLLCNDEDTKTNFNILFSTFILHEVVHLLQYKATLYEDSIYSEVYKLHIDKIKSDRYTIFDKIKYFCNHDKYLTEKSAICYSFQIILEILKDTDLISNESMDNFISIYLNNLSGYYRYDNNIVIGECFDTYRLLKEERKYNSLYINPNIPLFIKMSNGFQLTTDEFDKFKDITCFFKPKIAKELIKKLKES